MKKQKSTMEEIFTPYSICDKELGRSTVQVCSLLPVSEVVKRVNRTVERRHPNTQWMLEETSTTQCPDRPRNKHYVFYYESTEVAERMNRFV